MSKQVQERLVELDKLIVEKDKLIKERNKLRKECDHTYPDGKSAIDKNGYFCKSCEICGWNDMGV